MASRGVHRLAELGPRMRAYRAPSMFQPHRARQALRDAHTGRTAPMLGIFMSFTVPSVARYLAPMGWDFVWIDWEHSSCNRETMTTLIHETIFMSEGRTIPFVRLPNHDHAAMGHVLDAGASVIVPQVDTVEQAREVVRASKFGSRSRGTRSAPPFHFIPALTDIPLDPALGDVYKNVNEQAAIIVQTESIEGIKNMDAILTECPEIDCCWLGTRDLRINMNFDFGNMYTRAEEPEWLDAVSRWQETVAKHDKPMGGFCLPPAPGWQQQGKGKSFLVTALDAHALLTTREALMAAQDEFVAADLGKAARLHDTAQDCGDEPEYKSQKMAAYA